MDKVYEINFFKSSYFVGSIYFAMMTLGLIYALFVTLKQHVALVLICLVCLLLMVCAFFLILFLFYFGRLKIYINGETVTYEMPDKVTKFNIKDIYKIEKSLSFAGVGYYVFFYDDKRKKRHVVINDNIQEYEDLKDYLERKSDIKTRWEGTFDVEKEKRPIVKILKIVFNVVITILILGLTVVYPYMSSLNRHRERQQHLPERFLWP